MIRFIVDFGITRVPSFMEAPMFLKDKSFPSGTLLHRDIYVFVLMPLPANPEAQTLNSNHFTRG